jgi:copper homeostasis protein CutC
MTASCAMQALLLLVELVDLADDRLEILDARGVVGDLLLLLGDLVGVDGMHRERGHRRHHEHAAHGDDLVDAGVPLLLGADR